MHVTPSPMARRLGALALAALIPLRGVAAPAAVAAVGSTLSTTQLGLPMLDPKPVGMTTSFYADVTPQDATGTVTFYDVSGGGKVELATVPLGSSPVLYTKRATWTVPADFATGTYLVAAEYNGDAMYAVSESGSSSFTVGPRPSAAQVTYVGGPHDGSGATAQKGDVVTVQARVADQGAYTPNPVPMSGTVTIKVDGVVAGSFAPDFGSVDISTAAWALGAHAITVSYASSDGNFSDSTSAAWPINLVANTVDVSGVGVQYGTFYPYRDGYRDTVAIRGNRLERETVAIRVYSPTNRVVKSASVAAGTGAYAVSWNGRSSTGAILANGTYRVVQTITDSLGARKTVTSYVVLSSKRLYYSTVTFSRLGTQFAKKADYWRAYAFTLPSATVYKTLKFGVNGSSGVPPARMGPQDFSVCGAATWASGCVTRSTSLPWTRAWVNVYGSTTRDHSGRTARLYVYLDPWYGGSAKIYSVRVIVTYGVLR